MSRRATICSARLWAESQSMMPERGERLAELLAMPLGVFVRAGEPLVVSCPTTRTQYLVPDWDWAEAVTIAGAHPRELVIASAEFEGSHASVRALVRRHMRGQAIGWVRRELVDKLKARGLR